MFSPSFNPEELKKKRMQMDRKEYKWIENNTNG
jgi:hypothetical protein